jgi:hypothetical protein
MFFPDPGSKRFRILDPYPHPRFWVFLTLGNMNLGFLPGSVSRINFFTLLLGTLVNRFCKNWSLELTMRVSSLPALTIVTRTKKTRHQTGPDFQTENCYVIPDLTRNLAKEV